MWNTKTIEGMEATCREEADGNCNKKINGTWLEVILYEAHGSNTEYYKYVYNNKLITREAAIKLLEA